MSINKRPLTVALGGYSCKDWFSILSSCIDSVGVVTGFTVFFEDKRRGHFGDWQNKCTEIETWNDWQDFSVTLWLFYLSDLVRFGYIVVIYEKCHTWQIIGRGSLKSVNLTPPLFPPPGTKGFTYSTTRKNWEDFPRNAAGYRRVRASPCWFLGKSQPAVECGNRSWPQWHIGEGFSRPKVQ